MNKYHFHTKPFVLVLMLIALSFFAYYYYLIIHNHILATQNLQRCSSKDTTDQKILLNDCKGAIDSAFESTDKLVSEYSTELSLDLSDIEYLHQKYDDIDFDSDANLTKSQAMYDLKLEIDFYSNKLKSMIHKDCTSNPNFQNCICNDILTIDEYTSLPSFDLVGELLAPAFSPYMVLDEKYNFVGTHGAYVLVNTNDNSKLEIQGAVQKLRSISNSAFIGADAEGGVVKRFSFAPITPLKDLVELSDEELSEEINNQAIFLKDLGFNWSLAPVLDLPTSNSSWIYPRAISTEPEVIKRVSTEYIDIFKTQKILTTPKHFPGHGDTTVDSHKDIPVITKLFEEWSKSDWLPFESIMNNSADSLMIGHLRYSNIDNENASFSSFWKDYVREKNFEGIIVSDDITMLAPKDSIECSKYIGNAINTGTDLVVFVVKPNCEVDTVFKIVREYVNLKQEDLIAKNNKIVALKKKYFCN